MSIIRRIRLTYTEGSSNKEYNISISAYDDGRHFVGYEYGAIGRALKKEYKNVDPLPLNEAIKLYDRLKNEKLKKGYQIDQEHINGNALTDAPAPQPIIEKKQTGLSPMLLNPIERADASHYQNNPEWCFQIKHDGERQIIHINEHGVKLSNRRGMEIEPPESALELAKQLAKVGITSAILDCERMSASDFIVFDLLHLNGTDLTGLNVFQRLLRLTSLVATFKACLSGNEFVMTSTAISVEEKSALLRDAVANNEEGIVLKHLNSPYTAGRPASGGNALKLKFYETATVRVISRHKTKSSVSIELHNNGTWVEVGNVTIPPNATTPSAGELIEVRYLYAYREGSLYQPTYIRPRTDLTDDAASIDQLKYKKTEIAA